MQDRLYLTGKGCMSARAMNGLKKRQSVYMSVVISCMLNSREKHIGPVIIRPGVLSHVGDLAGLPRQPSRPIVGRHWVPRFGARQCWDDADFADSLTPAPRMPSAAGKGPCSVDAEGWRRSKKRSKRVAAYHHVVDALEFARWFRQAEPQTFPSSVLGSSSLQLWRPHGCEAFVADGAVERP